MKRILFFALSFTALVACQREDIENVGFQKGLSSGETFMAVMDESSTKSTFDGNKLRWEDGDKVVIFPGFTSPHFFEVPEGAGGKVSAELTELPYDDDWNGDGRPDYTPSDDVKINANIGCYPYTGISGWSCVEGDGGSYVIKTRFDDEPQEGIFPMIAVSDGVDDKTLQFKNLCGMLKVSLKAKGGDVDFAGLILKGNDGEILAGNATVTASYNANPVIEMSESGSNTITVYAESFKEDHDALCYDRIDEGIVTIKEGCTLDCYIPVPPTVFKKGITLGVATTSDVIYKTVSSEISIERSHVKPMALIELEPAPTTIYYTTTDKNTVSCVINATDAAGNALSWTNKYEYNELFGEEIGQIEFSGVAYRVAMSFDTDITNNPNLKRLEFISNRIILSDVSYMFRGCSNLSYVDLSVFDMSEVQSMAGMFRNCTSLRSVDFRGIRTPSLLNTSGMFDNCSSLSSIKFGDDFDTSDIVSMDYMFNRCTSLESLDISGFNTSNATNVEMMFANNPSLRTIIVGPKTNACAFDNTMFSNIATNGTLYYPAGSDYSDWLSNAEGHLGAYGWAGIETGSPSIIETPEAVDLGLPSGIKWASCNLGASKPEDYGGYYQWAGLQDVTDTSINLDWSNCPYHIGTDGNTGWTKYVPSNMSSYWSGPGSPDNKSVLDPEDDVAHVKLGDKWRMPTVTEFYELLSNCTSEWTTLNGVNGRKFTSMKNGNSIFLPAAGSRYFDLVDGVGICSYYWFSSLYTRQPSAAYCMYFSSGGVTWSDFGRGVGCSVRPVCENTPAGGSGSGEYIGYEDWN